MQASARTPTDYGSDWLYGDFGGYLYVTQEVLSRTRASTQRAIVENEELLPLFGPRGRRWSRTTSAFSS